MGYKLIIIMDQLKTQLNIVSIVVAILGIAITIMVAAIFYVIQKQEAQDAWLDEKERDIQHRIDNLVIHNSAE